MSAEGAVEGHTESVVTNPAAEAHMNDSEHKDELNFTLTPPKPLATMADDEKAAPDAPQLQDRTSTGGGQHAHGPGSRDRMPSLLARASVGGANNPLGRLPERQESALELRKKAQVDEGRPSGQQGIRKRRNSFLEKMESEHPSERGPCGFVRVAQRKLNSITYKDVKMFIIRYFTSTFWGQMFILSIVAVFLVTLGTISLMYFVIGNPQTETYDKYRFNEALWLSWGLFFDPGTQTGLEPTSHTDLKAIGAMFSIAGFVFNLTVLGTVVDFVRSGLEKHRRLHLRLHVTNHVLVLGWCDKTPFLLGELMEMTMHDGEMNTIVVMGELDKYEMLEQIQTAFPGEPRVRNIICWQGTTYEINDLERVNVGAARAVIVLGQDRNPRAADAQVTTTILALQEFKGRNFNLLVEVRQEEKVPVFERLNSAPKPLLVPAQEMSMKVTALCALQPVLGQLFVNLMSFIGEEVYAVEVAGTDMEGMTINDASFTFPTSIPIAVHSNCTGGGASLLQVCPPRDYVLREDDMLYVISADSQEAQRRSPTPKYRHADDISEKLKGMETHVLATTHMRERRTVVIIGYRMHETAVLLKVLASHLDIGSRVVISSAAPICARGDLKHSIALMFSYGIQVVQVVGSSTSNDHLKKVLYLARDCTKMQEESDGGCGHTKEDANRHYAENNDIPTHTKMRHRPSIIITGDDEYDSNPRNTTANTDAQVADANTLTTAILLDTIREQEIAAIPHSKRTYDEQERSPATVCEFTDDLTRRLVKKGKTLEELPACLPCHRLELESGFFALSSLDYTGARVLEAMLDKRAAPGAAHIPIVEFFDREELEKNKYTYWDIAHRCGCKDYTLVGWHRTTSKFDDVEDPERRASDIMARDETTRFQDFGNVWVETTVNPVNRCQELKWLPADTLVVLGRFDIHERSQEPCKYAACDARDKFMETAAEDGFTYASGEPPHRYHEGFYYITPPEPHSLVKGLRPEDW